MFNSRLFGGALLAGASLLSVFGTTAEASVPGHSAGVESIESCFEPLHVPNNHVKQCGLDYVTYNYKYTYSPNGGVVYCYVFDAVYFNRGSRTDLGNRESCAR